jgi:tRNA (pseudouridine54-N1)-methyltransferase
MRHFIYFSTTAATSGKALSKFANGGLMKAGRMDIAIHSFIQGIFLSHDIREKTIFHFVFYGMPDPPKHIEIHSHPDLEVTKKDVSKFIQKMLYKYKPSQKTEVMKGCFIEKKSLFKVIDELKEKGNEIFILDKHGKDLREIEIPENCAFLLGDHEGLPKKELKRIKEECNLISVGPHMYFASQTVAVVNNELDRRGI